MASDWTDDTAKVQLLINLEVSGPRIAKNQIISTWTAWSWAWIRAINLLEQIWKFHGIKGLKQPVLIQQTAPWKETDSKYVYLAVRSSQKSDFQQVSWRFSAFQPLSFVWSNSQGSLSVSPIYKIIINFPRTRILLPMSLHVTTR